MMIRDTSLYDVLGVEPSASIDDIKKAFRKKLCEFQMGANSSSFSKEKIVAAFTTLSNTEERAAYDRLFLQSPTSSCSSLTIHAGGFGMGGGGCGGIGARESQQSHDAMDALMKIFNKTQRTPDIIISLKVTLEEIFSGCHRSPTITKTRFCQRCNGKGAFKENFIECKNCDSRGWYFSSTSTNTIPAASAVAPTTSSAAHHQQQSQEQYRQRDCDRRLFPNDLFANFIEPGVKQEQCDVCLGYGEIMKKPCDFCYGEKIVHVKTRYNLRISKGVKNGKRVVYSGEGNERPGFQTGDLVFVIEQEAHEVFTRINNNLVTTISLSLSEALCGFTKTLKMLDRQTISFSSKPGEIIKPGSTKLIKGKGMPFGKRNQKFGDLIMKFHVNFPSNINFDVDIKNILTNATNTTATTNTTIVNTTTAATTNSTTPTTPTTPTTRTSSVQQELNESSSVTPTPIEITTSEILPNNIEPSVMIPIDSLPNVTLTDKPATTESRRSTTTTVNNNISPAENNFRLLECNAQ